MLKDFYCGFLPSDKRWSDSLETRSDDGVARTP